jgi:hypothetical protein
MFLGSVRDLREGRAAQAFIYAGHDRLGLAVNQSASQKERHVSDDPYEILGVPRDATPEQIKKAYRKKAKEAHPDREDGDNTEMVAINRAKDILSDPAKRSKFDETGSTAGSSEPTIEDMARMSLARAFDGLLSDEVNFTDYDDVIAGIRKAIQAALVEYEVEIKTVDQYCQKLEKKAARVKFKNPEGHDLWSDTIADRKKRYAGIRAHACQKAEVAKIALAMLDDYECEVTAKPPAKPSPVKQQPGDIQWIRADDLQRGTWFRDVFGGG